MAEVAVLREFLVSLGFKVDKGSEKQFTNTVAAITVEVAKLGATAAAASALAVTAMARIAGSLESLYYTSKRNNATVENIEAIGFAFSQMGSSSEEGLATIESIGRLLRTSPGGEGLLKNIGVQTRDANGQLRDTGELVADLGDRFANMPYYKANAFAQALGIDEKSLMAMREGTGAFSAEYKQMLAAAGLDAQQAAKDSHAFMVELRGLGTQAVILGQAVASRLIGRLTESLRQFRESGKANLGRIVDGLAAVLGLLLRAGAALAILVGRGAQVFGYLADRFGALSDRSKTLIEILAGVLVAWKLLNSGFLASPIGRIIALITALGLLWDDYQTWKEGGKSLIDWSAWAPGIEAAISAISRLAGAIHDLLAPLGDVRPAFELLLAYVAGTWITGMLASIARAAAAMVGLGTATAGAASAASVAAPAALAGGAGYVAGSLLYRHAIEGTAADNAIGGALAKTMAFFGSQDAKDALAARARGQIAAPAPAAQPAAPAAAAPTARPATPPPAAPMAPKTSDPRGIRNNNPGNIEFGPYARARGAVGPEDSPAHRFARFESAQQGLDALAILLRQYAAKGINSVQDIIGRYSPKGDKGNVLGSTENYIASTAKRLGVNPQEHLNMGDPKIMAGMMDAIIRFENSRNPYKPEQINAAVAAADGAKPVGITQTTTITVQGGSDKEVARPIVAAQNSVNDRLVRNMRGAVVQ